MPSDKADSGSPHSDTVIRDRLAQIRTQLANERTFLAYLRTALAFLIGGVSAVHFLTHPAAVTTGYILALLGLMCLVVGLFRFYKLLRILKSETSG